VDKRSKKKPMSKSIQDGTTSYFDPFTANSLEGWHLDLDKGNLSGFSS